MTTSLFQQERQAIAAQIRQANERITGLEGQIRDIDQELQGLFAQKQQYQLLNDICESLDKLESLGAGHLFWGQEPDSDGAKQRVGAARSQATQFLETINGIEQQRKLLEEGIDGELLNIDAWNIELADLDKAEESKLSEFLIERDISELPYHAMAMPWDQKGDDAKRFRKSLILVLLITFSIGGGMMAWKLPPVDKYAKVEIPERVVKFVKNEPPPKPKVERKKEEEKKEEEKKPDEKKVAEKPAEKKPSQTATKEEIKAARTKAESSGVLAFKNTFADMMEDDSTLALGADASVKGSGSAGNQAPGGVGNGAPGSRSLIAAQGAAGSGGIANAGISRGGVGSGGGAGGAIAGGGFTAGKQTSTIANMKDKDTKLTAGAGPARTDEEIQIVFDKYKSALYRIYNRELRNDPTLRGKMVLSLTIEPDGSVSACKVQSTDMNSPALSADIVARVLKFNFGAKEGVPATKILYPIDFLPAS